jgi:hypothetical protein
MEQSQVMVMPSPQPQRGSSARSRPELVSEWLARFSANNREPLNDESSRILLALWCDAFSDLTDAVLENAFLRTLRSCRFFPTIADVRSHIDKTRETATAQDAEIAWQRILDLRRRYWNPDLPSGFSRGMPNLPGRVDRAARASGIFNLQDCEPEDIHVWAKKRFIESYIAWTELEQDQFLLPDGEVKNLLASVAETKKLPSSGDAYEVARAAGEKHRDEVSALVAMVSSMTGRRRESTPIVATKDRLGILEMQEHKLGITDEDKRKAVERVTGLSVAPKPSQAPNTIH